MFKRLDIYIYIKKCLKCNQFEKHLKLCEQLIFFFAYFILATRDSLRKFLVNVYTYFA